MNLSKIASRVAFGQSAPLKVLEQNDKKGSVTWLGEGPDEISEESANELVDKGYAVWDEEEWGDYEAVSLTDEGKKALRTGEFEAGLDRESRYV